MTEHVMIPNEMPDAVRHEIAMLLCSGGRNVASDIYRKVVESGIPALNYDRRITELLEANNREVFRRREAEAKLSSTAAAAPTTMENAAFLTEPASEQITPERLRQFAYDCGFGPGKRFNTVNAAADRIEALEATNAKLLAALKTVMIVIGADTRPPFGLINDYGMLGLSAFIAARAAIAAAKGESK